MKGAIMKISDKLLLRKRAIIETVNNELKNIAQVEHSRYRLFDNFIVNTLGALAVYCFFPKKTIYFGSFFKRAIVGSSAGMKWR